MILALAALLATWPPVPAADPVGEAATELSHGRAVQAREMIRAAVAGGASGAAVDRLLADLAFAERRWPEALVRYAALIEAGPISSGYGVVCRRLVDLIQWLWEEYRITVAKQTLSRELRAMGYRKLSARPRHHAQAEGAIEDFKKSSQRAWMKSRAKRQSMLGK